MKKIQLSDALAMAGAVALVAGIALLKPAAGIIALGVLLLLGAVATAKLKTPQQALSPEQLREVVKAASRREPTAA
jgi:hypothetical protein